jgi:hypothetical protein
MIETGDGAAGEKEYSRRKHRRKKEMRKAMDAVEQTKSAQRTS